MNNLKQLLMELGNELVLNYGFVPATQDRPIGNRNTQAIANLTEWINETPEAQQILAEKGFEWPVVEK